MRTLVSVALLVSASAFAAEVKLGQPLALTTATPIGQIVASPGAWVGKTVQVKGKVTEVCQKMGCWMNIVDPATNAMIRIKVKDGEIVFPKDSPGKTAVVEGKLVKLVLTKEQALATAKHEAEANGKKFDEKSVTSGRTIYQVQGTGAVLMD